VTLKQLIREQHRTSALTNSVQRRSFCKAPLRPQVGWQALRSQTPLGAKSGGILILSFTVFPCPILFRLTLDRQPPGGVFSLIGLGNISFSACGPKVFYVKLPLVQLLKDHNGMVELQPKDVVYI
jgi:hypothetical protein